MHRGTNRHYLVKVRCTALSPSTALYQLAASRWEVTILRIKWLLGNEIRELGLFLPVNIGYGRLASKMKLTNEYLCRGSDVTPCPSVVPYVSSKLRNLQM